MMTLDSYGGQISEVDFFFYNVWRLEFVFFCSLTFPVSLDQMFWKNKTSQISSSLLPPMYPCPFCFLVIVGALRHGR